MSMCQSKDIMSYVVMSWQSVICVMSTCHSSLERWGRECYTR